MSSYHELLSKNPLNQCSQIQVFVNVTNPNDIIFKDSKGSILSTEHVIGLLILALKDSYYQFEHIKKGIQTASYNHITNN